MHNWLHKIAYTLYISFLDICFPPSSAGVGRTGTFIAIDAMMQRLKEKNDFNIYNFVTQMRNKRTFMVQNLVSRPNCIWGVSLQAFRFYIVKINVYVCNRVYHLLSVVTMVGLIIATHCCNLSGFVIILCNICCILKASFKPLLHGLTGHF